MRVVGLQREGAVVQHGGGNNRKAEGYKVFRLDFPFLRQHRYHGGEQRNHKGPWTQSQYRIRACVAIEFLQDFGNHGGAAEEHKAEKEIEDTGEREVALAEQP